MDASKFESFTDVHDVINNHKLNTKPIDLQLVEVSEDSN